jgi:hypothetical protein
MRSKNGLQLRNAQSGQESHFLQHFQIKSATLSTLKDRMIPCILRIGR